MKRLLIKKEGRFFGLNHSAQIDGFDKHLINPAHSDVQKKLLANKPEPLGMYFTYTPSEETVQGLVSFGFKVDVLTPWKGTNRLTEIRHEDYVQIIAFLYVNDITAYQEFAERIEETIASQPGFLYHQSFKKSESQVFAMGEWADVSSLISWLKIFEEEFGKEFQSLVTNQNMYAACNKPSDELRELMSAWNAPIYEKVAGFVRY